MSYELVSKADVLKGTILSNGTNGLRTLSPHKDRNNTQPRLAVEVREAYLTYGRGKKAHHALKGINLKVPEGAIYGLLGASGCGKTTLLNAVNGCLSLNSGTVEVFGVTPGTKYSSIPGRGVGFMPQELALYPDFTIQETLLYFGRLHQMDAKTIKARAVFLLKFLDLPKQDAFIANLSGGQQRRVSLAVALIHQPPLLILDEPTVGVDIMLRESIWEHLVELTTNEGLTVIITTHYIEEAAQANIVGLLRQGRILAENTPANLMSQLQEPTLEKCFLKLCKMNSEEDTPADQSFLDAIANRPLLKRNFVLKRFLKDKLPQIPPVKDSTPTAPTSDELEPEFKSVQCDNQFDKSHHRATPYSFRETFNNISTLFWKNLQRLKRNVPVLLFQLVLPALQVVLVCTAVGPKAFGLVMAIVNDEEPAEYSQRFLDLLDNTTIVQKPYPNLESAIDSVHKGYSAGALYIGKEFTTHVLKRIEDGIHASSSSINGSIVRIFLDATNRQNALTVQKSLFDSFQEFTAYMLTSLQSSPALAQIPLQFETPIYGSYQDTYTEFVISGVNMNVAYFMAVSLTVLSSIGERKSGFMVRNWVSGVTTNQILSSQMLTQSLVLAGQILGLFVFTYGIFQIPSRGPLFWVVLLFFLQGLFGMAYGLLISGFIQDESTAMVIFLGTFYPSLLICGIVWPLEAQPYFLRYFSLCLPQTIPTEAVRAIMSRGWGIEHTVVWSGIAITIGWTLVCLFAAAVVFKSKR